MTRAIRSNETALDKTKWQNVAEELGLPDIDLSLLRQAFTHSSYVREQQPEEVHSNERLEFLGDVVLDLIIAEHLYMDAPDLAEGQLTRIKAHVVRERTLAQLARQLRLGEYLLLSHGEEDSGGRHKSKLLGDALEAVIGAIYICLGLEAARNFVLEKLAPMLAEAQTSSPPLYDHKSRLQELIQAYTKRTPEYVMIAAEGPPHDRTFAVGVRFCDLVLGRGSGPSKQSAEEAAALQALADQQHWLPSLEELAE